MSRVRSAFRRRSSFSLFLPLGLRRGRRLSGNRSQAEDWQKQCDCERLRDQKADQREHAATPKSDPRSIFCLNQKDDRQRDCRHAGRDPKQPGLKHCARDKRKPGFEIRKHRTKGRRHVARSSDLHGKQNSDRTHRQGTPTKP